MTSARSFKLQSQGLPSGNGTICARQSASTLTNCDKYSATSVPVRPCAACVRQACNSHSAAWQAPFRKFSSLREFTNCFSTGIREHCCSYVDMQPHIEPAARCGVPALSPWLDGADEDRRRRGPFELIITDHQMPRMTGA